MNEFFKNLIKEAIGIDPDLDLWQNAANATQQITGAGNVNDAIQQSTQGKGKGKGKVQR